MQSHLCFSCGMQNINLFSSWSSPRSKLVSKHPPNFYLQWQKSSTTEHNSDRIAHVCFIFRMATAVIGRCIFGQLNKLQKCKTIAKVTNIQCRNISISQRLLGGRCHFICAVENEQWTWRIIIHYNNSVNDLRFKYSNCEYMWWYLWPIYHIAEVNANFSRILIYLHNALIEIINETMTS